jgi:glycosyltransferase involved in cell wall biosynthesis
MLTDFPDVDLILITYNRYDIILKTITALEENLLYPREHLRYLIADDCTPGDYQQRLADTEVFKRLYNYEFVPGNKNLGWGGNANRVLDYSTAPYQFQIEDDYILKKPLDLQAAVACMQVKPEIGMMRFRGTAGDHIVFHQMEADISSIMPDYQEGVGLPGKLTYLLFDSGSPGLYIYSHGAHLKRANFHEFYGKYPEGLKLGHTEESYAHMVKDYMRSNPYAPVIAIQPAWIAMFFDHIGISFQHTELDVEGGKVHV